VGPVEDPELVLQISENRQLISRLRCLKMRGGPGWTLGPAGLDEARNLDFFMGENRYASCNPPTQIRLDVGLCLLFPDSGVIEVPNPLFLEER